MISFLRIGIQKMCEAVRSAWGKVGYAPGLPQHSLKGGSAAREARGCHPIRVAPACPAVELHAHSQHHKATQCTAPSIIARGLTRVVGTVTMNMHN